MAANSISTYGNNQPVFVLFNSPAELDFERHEQSRVISSAL